MRASTHARLLRLMLADEHHAELTRARASRSSVHLSANADAVVIVDDGHMPRSLTVTAGSVTIDAPIES